MDRKRAESGPFVDAFHEQPGNWGENPAGEPRMAAAQALVPGGVSSILDVGCGEGSFLRGISAGFRIGADRSRAALAACPDLLRVRAGAGSLPFAFRSLDLVSCTEVLEHLPEDEFRLALSEFRRVADRFILVSVPWQEQLARRQARCAGCGRAFHVHGHLRSFGPGSLESLFRGFRLERTVFAGPVERDFPAWALALRRLSGRYEWEPLALCPGCGKKADGPPGRTPVSILTTLSARAFGPRHRKWVCCLYARRTDCRPKGMKS